MQQVEQIAFIGGRSVVSAAIARGIAGYARRQALPWALITIEPKAIDRSGSAVQARLDAPYLGVLGFLDEAARDWAAGKGCPRVRFGGGLAAPREVVIGGDDRAIGVMAARHLVEQGYRSFACSGRWGIGVIARRYDAFIGELSRLGHGCRVDDQDVGGRHAGRGADPEVGFAAWLRSLPAPTALFFHQDRPAIYAAELCAAHGIAVPGHIAILGADDVVDACEACQPPLSSVALPWEHLGELGGLHLHRMLGGDPGGHVLCVPPLRVAARASTARPRPADPLVERCLRRLERDHAKALRAADLVAELGVDPSTLHRHLVAATGAGFGDHLHRLRIERARELLATTALPVAAIARMVGYASRQRFGAMFRRRTATSPQEYRAVAHGESPFG